MIVTRTAALTLFQSLKMHSVTDKLNNKALELKLNKLPKTIQEDDFPEEVLKNLDETDEGILKDIITDLQAGKAIKVVEDDDPKKDEPKEKPAKKPAPKGRKAKTPVQEEEDEEEPEEEDEEEEEEEEEKPKKGKGKKPAKKEEGKRAGFTRVGIVDAVADCLKGTSKTKPVTKQQVLDTLMKKFPQRAKADNGKGMKHTIDVQLNYPKYSTLIGRRGMNIVKTEKGYYLGKGEPSANGATNKPTKAEKKEKPKAKAAKAKK